MTHTSPLLLYSLSSHRPVEEQDLYILQEQLVCYLIRLCGRAVYISKVDEQKHNCSGKEKGIHIFYVNVAWSSALSFIRF